MKPKQKLNHNIRDSLLFKLWVYSAERHEKIPNHLSLIFFSLNCLHWWQINCTSNTNICLHSFQINRKVPWFLHLVRYTHTCTSTLSGNCCVRPPVSDHPKCEYLLTGGGHCKNWTTGASSEKRSRPIYFTEDNNLLHTISKLHVHWTPCAVPCCY